MSSRRRRLPRFKPDAKVKPEVREATLKWGRDVEVAVAARFVDRIISEVEAGFRGVPVDKWTAYHVASFTHAVLTYVVGLPESQAVPGGQIHPNLAALIPTAFLVSPDESAGEVADVGDPA